MVDISTAGIVTAVPVPNTVAVGIISPRAFGRRNRSVVALTPSWLSSNQPWKTSPGGCAGVYTVLYTVASKYPRGLCVIPYRDARYGRKNTTFFFSVYSVEATTTAAMVGVRVALKRSRKARAQHDPDTRSPGCSRCSYHETVDDMKQS